MISRTGLIVSGFGIAALVVAGVLLFHFTGWIGQRNPKASVQTVAPIIPDTLPRPAATPAALQETRSRMEFRRDGDAAKPIREVERAAGTECTSVALKKEGAAIWVCLLVAAPERYVDVDQGWSLADFPALRDKGFKEPPGPYVKTMSIYRSLAQSALNCNRARGDRMVVIVCPKAEWSDLALRWPAPCGEGR
jgi:hypothetical protein